MGTHGGDVNRHAPPYLVFQRPSLAPVGNGQGRAFKTVAPDDVFVLRMPSGGGYGLPPVSGGGRFES